MGATSPSSRPSHQDDILIPDDIGIVGRLFQANVDVLTHTLREAKTGSNVSSTHQRALMRILQSLVLWGESNDIESGALDATLQRSRRLLRATLSPLRSMGIVPIAFGLSTFLNIIRESDMDILLDAARATVESEDYIQQVASESEDSTDEATGCDKIESHVRDLQIFMRCLVDLTETLASAVPDPHYDNPKPVQVESLEPHHLYAGLIREKFPFGDAKIVDHLGKSNLRRYQEIIARKEAMVANEAKPQTQGEAQPYEATNIAGETVWKDSGLGTSVPTFSKPPSSYMPSRRSSNALKNPDWIPKLTAEAVAGHAFECFGCGQMVVIKKDVDWKKHLIKDLSPYNCTAPDCTDAFTLFSEKHKWIRHMKTEHEAESIPQSQCCPLYLVNTHDEKEDFFSHLSTHLEEISVAALPRGAFDDSDSDDESSKEANSIRLPSRNETATESASNLLAFWGYMFEPDKAPTRLFNALNHAMATYIMHKIGDPNVPWLTPQKMTSFYKAVGGDYDCKT
ncbi:ankyrin repeat [Fusarium sp. NRRL 25303]|nr:ankyrin repeat [Fusarium sp. NRRL 25303]